MAAVGAGIFKQGTILLHHPVHVLPLFAGDRGRGRAEGEQVSPRGLRYHRAVPVGAAAPLSTGSHAVLMQYL